MAAFREPLDDVRADGVPVVGYAVRDGALVGRDRPGVPAAAGLDLLDADRTERGQGTILGCLGLRIRTDGGFPAPAGLVLIPEREPVPAWQQCRAGVPCAIRGQRGAGEDRSGLSDDIHREGQDRGSREIGPSVPPSSEPSMAAGGDTRRFVRGRGGEDAREPAPEPLEARSVGHHPQPIRSRVMANPGLPRAHARRSAAPAADARRGAGYRPDRPAHALSGERSGHRRAGRPRFRAGHLPGCADRSRHADVICADQ